ncbi:MULTISPECIES: tyrosine-type recombinase/integrase [Rhodococcus]|uniref:tyrosine-type recombinase/integrase n=1 Tax=Rhodococcus TaxID=1827 RepID=UPI00167C5488|nr:MULTISPECIES: tyrosine-type recombinase/integrase [Rhodococcus]
MSGRGRPGPAPDPIPPHWARWIEVFVAEQRAAQRSGESVRTRIHHLRKFAGEHPRVSPLEVTRDHLIAYMAGQDWTPHTAHSVRSTFRVFFRTLRDLEHRSDDPARTLPQVRLPRSRPRPCPDHVIAAAYANAPTPQVRLALRIAVETGLRRAEIAQLRTSDVEGRPGEYALHVVGKGRHERVVPLADDLAEGILAVRTVHVFPNPLGGGAMTPQHLGKLITSALPGNWTTHTLRHRFATMAYQADRDLRAVQELLGHTSPVTTAVYTKVADDAMRTAARAAALVATSDKRQ